MSSASPMQREGRVPPHYLPAEKAVLCCCLDSREALMNVASELVPDHFYHPGHRLIYMAMLELFAARKPVDIITVSESLNQSGEIEAVGGLTYISELSNMLIVRSSVREYVSIIKQKYTLRKLIATMDEIVKFSYDGEQEANGILDVAIKRLSDMRESPLGGGFERLHEILKRSFQEIKEIAEGKKERHAVRTGFAKLDQVTGGFRPGTLLIVAARPAMGKSALVINMAVNASVLYGANVAFFSLEMSKEEICNRILSSKSSISAFKLQNAVIHKDEFIQIEDALNILKPAPLFIDDRSGVSTVEMMAKCRQLKNEHGLDLVVIDYLQLMSATSSRNQGNRQQEISEISRSLKIMAKELNVPIIALSQLSRGAEQRDEHRPVLSDLRDSGAIEQDADMVMFIYRKLYYNNDPVKPEIEDAEIILAKNRQGPTKTVHLKWWAKRTLFFEDSDPGEPVAPDMGPQLSKIMPEAFSQNMPGEIYVPDSLTDNQDAMDDLYNPGEEIPFDFDPASVPPTPDF